MHFKDRDRGGRGIDAENERNRGKRISSSDCDLYVAVDKQLAICYIIPTTQIEAWNKDTISVSEAAEYRETLAIEERMKTDPEARKKWEEYASSISNESNATDEE